MINWYIFLAIESDLERAARYVEPVEANDLTYSIEFMRLLMGAAAEAEVIAKVLCEQVDPGTRLDSIDHWRDVLLKHFPKLPSMEVIVPRASRRLAPWASWAAGTNPVWWVAHNDVKHNRHKYFEQGNQLNALSATAGLLCLQVYLHREEYLKGGLEPWCHLLSLEGHYEAVVTGEGGRLPDFQR